MKRGKPELRVTVLLAADVARILGWEPRRARRWLIASGAGVKRNGRWVTTPELLANYWPELANGIRAAQERLASFAGTTKRADIRLDKLFR